MIGHSRTYNLMGRYHSAAAPDGRRSAGKVAMSVVIFLSMVILLAMVATEGIHRLLHTRLWR